MLDFLHACTHQRSSNEGDKMIKLPDLGKICYHLAIN